MSLKQAVETVQVDPRRKCGLADWLGTLPADELEYANILLNDRERTVSYVTEAFRGEGFTRGVSCVSRHRNGGCACVSQ